MPCYFHIVGIVNDLCIYIYRKVLFHSLFLIYSFILKAIKVLTQEISFLLTLSFHLPTEIEPRRVEDHLRCSWYQQLWALTTDEKHTPFFGLKHNQLKKLFLYSLNLEIWRCDYKIWVMLHSGFCVWCYQTLSIYLSLLLPRTIDVDIFLFLSITKQVILYRTKAMWQVLSLIWRKVQICSIQWWNFLQPYFRVLDVYINRM